MSASRCSPSAIAIACRPYPAPPPGPSRCAVRAGPPAARAAATAADRMQAMPSDDAVARLLDDTRRICAMPAPPFGEGPRAELVAWMLGEAGAPPGSTRSAT